MKIFVHCGLNKAGSTALQSALAQHARSLWKTDGLFVPIDAGPGDRWRRVKERRPFAGHANLFWQEAGHREFRAHDLTWEKLADLIAYHNPPALALTSEFFRRPFAGKLNRKLEAFGGPIQVVNYFRPQQDLIGSHYSQAVKFGWWDQSPAEFVRQFLNSPKERGLNFGFVAAGFANQFGAENASIRLLDPATLHGGHILADFLDFCGIDHASERFDRPGTHNLSPSGPALDLIRYVTRQLNPNRDPDRLQALYRSVYVPLLHKLAEIDHAHDRRGFTLDEDLATRVVNHYRQVNEAFLRDHAPDLRPEHFTTLKSRRASDEPAILDHARIAAILTRIAGRRAVRNVDPSVTDILRRAAETLPRSADGSVNFHALA